MGKVHWPAAAALYLGAALFAFRVVLPDPRGLLPYSAHLRSYLLAVDQTDQQFVVASISHASRAMLQAPWTLWDNRQCHPMARPVTLGEHMFGEALLGALPALLTGDPVFTYNAVLILGVWIAGLTMFALVRYWTSSTAAALVAGLLFAIQPGRLGDPTHPFVHGDLWSPLVLLATHVLFVRRTWGAAAALAVAIALVLLESLYVIFALVLIALVYVPYLLVRHRRALAALVPKLLAVAAVSAGVAAVIFTPYLHTRDVWGVLTGRPGLLFPPEQFLPGAFYYPGTVVVVLAAVALADRLRGARPLARGDDPRLAMFAAAALVFWTVVWSVPVPGTELAIPSPYAWLQARLPGLSAIRAVPAARTGMYLCLIVLAGYGVWVLTRRLGPRGRAATTVVLLAAAALETFEPNLADWTLGVSPVPMKTRRVLALPPVRALGRILPDGAVLDLPFRLDDLGRLAPMTHFIFLGAYHGRPVAACYNSFTVPILDQVGALAARVPEPAALAALHALGYRGIVSHEEFLAPEAREPFRARLEGARGGPLRLVQAGVAGSHRAYRIDGTQPVTSDLAVLSADPPPGPTERVAPSDTGAVRFRIRNAGGETFRLAAPIEPSDLLVRWRALPEGRVVTATTQALLPIALAAGETQEMDVVVQAPGEAGRYEVEVALATAPDRPIARMLVEVDA
ncbi:MAG TPA: hypothetical protein VNO26_06265 [Candidatus Limnocylindria bacterium]|nr:hypothetical protein [Candidatus Limnocylindria bacterium]